MSRTANCYDNAVIESFWATLKTERTDDQAYGTRSAAQTDVFLFIKGFYNRRRRRCPQGAALGYRSRDDFEHLFQPRV